MEGMEASQISHLVFTIFLPVLVYALLLLLILPFLIFKFLRSLIRAFLAEDVNGKVVLITGASSGLGEQLAYQYAKRGARLVLVARRKQALHEVAKRARQIGSPEVLVIPSDVTNPEECERFIKATMAHFGQLDHLVNNAGAASMSLLEEVADISRHHQITDLNFWGAVYPTYFAISHLRRAGGKIVVTASSAGNVATPRLTFYCASKAAVLRFYEALSVEISPEIKITIATPGYIESEMTMGKSILKDGEMGVDQLTRDVIIPLPVASSVACAEAIVDGACRGEKYVTWPSWYRAIGVVSFVAPEVLEWIFRGLFLSRRGTPRENALGKRLLDALGAHKFHPASIRSAAIKPC